MSSSDFETPITKKKSKKKRNEPRNEGTNPHWAYEPPQGAVLLDHAVDPGPFAWDALDDDDDTELWLIRVPDTIKPKHLDKLEIDPPSSSHTARIGGIARKHASYDVWSVADDGTGADTGPGGEDLFGLTCLLPRREDERLLMAPKPVARRIVITARPSAPASPPAYQNTPRHVYPDEVLKHAFVPYGARSVEDMDTQDLKAKKRKAHGDAHKKSKKHKTSS